MQLPKIFCRHRSRVALIIYENNDDIYIEVWAQCRHFKEPTKANLNFQISSPCDFSLCQPYTRSSQTCRHFLLVQMLEKCAQDTIDDVTWRTRTDVYMYLHMYMYTNVHIAYKINELNDVRRQNIYDENACDALNTLAYM